MPHPAFAGGCDHRKQRCHERFTSNSVEPTLPVKIDHEIMSDTAVFSGIRVPVKTLFDYLLDDCTIAEFLDNFPINHANRQY